MLEAVELVVAYGTDEPGGRALDGVSLSVPPGSVVAVVGANGSGKSTLARALCGARLADAGQVAADGHDPAADQAERRAVRRLVGSVGQHPADQIVAARVYDEVAFGPRNLGLEEAEVAARVARALGRCGLAGFEDRATSELSGGEEQRLALAGVLAMEPCYLVLDEPAAHLDPAQRVAFRQLVGELAHGQGAGIALITHDAADVLAADTVCVLERGHVAWSGAPRALQEERPDLWGALLGFRGDGSIGVRFDGSIGVWPQSTQAHAGDGAGTASALELVDVDFSYGRGGRPVLDGFCLRARAGRVLLLAGPSGAGKSTVAAVAAGLLAPDAGQVLLDGCPVAPGAVGLAFQNPERHFFQDTVYDEVAFAPRNLGCSEEEVAARVRSALAAVGLDEDFAERDPFALSGGQARRAGLASALSVDAPACVFDEPTAGLDLAGRRDLHRTVRALADAGRIVIVISHDVDEWRAVADEVVELAPPSRPQAAGDNGEGGAVAPAGAPGSARRQGALDARVKIALLFGATIGLFCSPAPVALALWAAVALGALWGAGVRAGELARAVRPAAFALALVLCANAVRCDGSGGIALAGPVGLSAAGARLGARAVARILVLVGLVVAMARTTTAAELADACVRLLRPLGRVGVPVESLGSALSLGLRFMPLVADEYQRIQLAQRARGVDFGAGGPLRRARRWLSVLAPLIIGLFRRADRLAEAMEARCYAGAGQTPARRLSWRDWVALAAGLLVMAFIVAVTG